MTGTNKNMVWNLGALLAAAILTIGAMSTFSSHPSAINPKLQNLVLCADGTVPPAPPLPLPGSGGTKRA
jgi:hypothetical protein